MVFGKLEWWVKLMDKTYKTVILSIDYKCKYGKLIDYLIENEDIGSVSKIKTLKR
jgi:hypothetical protein